MKKYLVPDSANPNKLVIVSASGFTPPNSIPLPEQLHGEEAEWLVVQDVFQQVPVQELDAEGQPVFQDEVVDTYDEEGNVSGQTTIQVPVYQTDEQGDLILVDSEQVIGQEVVVNSVLKTQILADRAAAQAAQQQEAALRAVLQNAVAFGTKLMEDFVMENIAMGITVDNMSEAVLDAMGPTEAALRTGTLHVALKRLKEIPAEQKDAKYITDARLLEAINKLEEYLGLPISETL